MRTSTLVQTLRLFSAKELDEIEAFIQSPYFNNGTHFNSILKLFRYLKTALLDPALDVEDSATVAVILSDSEQPVQKSYLSNLNSELLALVRQYIAWQVNRTNWGNCAEEILNAQFYQERGAFKLKEKMLNRAVKTIDKQQHSPKETPLLRFWLEDSLFQLENIQNARKGDLNLPNTIEALTVFYACELMNKAMTQIQQKRVYPEYEPAWDKLLLEMRGIFRNHQYFNSTLIQLIDEALLLFEQPQKDVRGQIDRYLQHFEAYHEQLPEETLKNLAAFARNFCNWKCNTGHTGLFQLRLELYRRHLEKGWLYVNGKLTPSIFINIINIGIWQEEFKWVKHVLESHTDKVEGNETDGLFNYAYASYYLGLGDLKRANDYLKKMLQHYKKFNDTNMNSHASVLEIKILYKEGDDLLLGPKLTNYRMYISRNTRYYSEASRTRKQRFRQFIQQLADLRECIQHKLVSKKEIQSRLATLKEELSAPEPITERIWLLQEVAVLQEQL